MIGREATGPPDRWPGQRSMRGLGAEPVDANFEPGRGLEDLNRNPLEAVRGLATTTVSGRKLPIRSAG
jgi:hypothetical protein